MSMNKEQLNLFFSGISSTSALIVTLLALWGVFFTSLPEKIMSEFRTDIKNTKEELIELRQEKRLIQKQNNKVLADNYRLEGINTSLNESLLDLKNERSTLQSEIKNYKEKESFSFSYQYNRLATNYLGEIRKELAKSKDNALYLSVFNQTKVWLASEPEQFTIKKEGSEIIYITKYQEWEEWSKKQPYNLRIYFSFNNEKESPEGHRKYIKTNLIKNKYKTLLMVIETKLLETKNNDIEKRAYNNLKNKVKNYIKENSGRLSIYIEPVIYISYSDNEVIDSGREALAMLETAELLISDFEMKLLN